MKILLKLLAYPLRYLLRHKVARYKKEIELINHELNEVHPMKFRRAGNTLFNTNNILNRSILLRKYESFVRNWEI